METENFGEHFMLDGYKGSFEELNQKDNLLKALNDLTFSLGMKQLASPVAYFAKGNDKKDPGGWSGFVVIEESHISIHTFPKKGFVSADVYTCKNGMNIEFIKKYFIDLYKLKDTETNFVKRGTRYPIQNLDKDN